MRNYPYNQKLVKNAQLLRRNMTTEEKMLWYQFLKRLPVTVSRQKNIGNYIVDFCIVSKQIIIELDGSQHAEPKHIESDRIRDEYLNSLGFFVLRYSNRTVSEQFQAVCRDILEKANIPETSLKPGKNPLKFT